MNKSNPIFRSLPIKALVAGESDSANSSNLLSKVRSRASKMTMHPSYMSHSAKGTMGRRFTVSVRTCARSQRAVIKKPEYLPVPYLGRRNPETKAPCVSSGRGASPEEVRLTNGSNGMIS
jgi:hypothetical protein